MGERTFLEDVGTPCSIHALGTARAWEVRHLREDATFPPVMYVIESQVGQQFLLGREMSGRPKFNTIRTIAKSFVELFFEQPHPAPFEALHIPLHICLFLGSYGFIQYFLTLWSPILILIDVNVLVYAHRPTPMVTIAIENG